MLKKISNVRKHRTPYLLFGILVGILLTTIAIKTTPTVYAFLKKPYGNYSEDGVGVNGTIHLAFDLPMNYSGLLASQSPRDSYIWKRGGARNSSGFISLLAANASDAYIEVSFVWAKRPLYTNITHGTVSLYLRGDMQPSNASPVFFIASAYYGRAETYAAEVPLNYSAGNWTRNFIYVNRTAFKAKDAGYSLQEILARASFVGVGYFKDGSNYSGYLDIDEFDIR